MHQIHWSFRYEAHHILLYILGIYLAILYINVGVVCYIKIVLVFSFYLYSLVLSINYFMVYYFKEVVKHNIKQMEIQTTI